MPEWRRQAIYFAPAAGGALAEAGAAWLGWDAGAGRERPVPPSRAALVAAPARYGFHATLKPPFRVQGEEAALDAAATRVAAEAPRFPLRLRLGWMGGFLALLPNAPPLALGALADACVTRLDGFRMPPGADELARRRAAGLDTTEMANLARWGYPWVLDRFRFHMTLTGPVHESLRPEVEAEAAEWFAPIVAQPLEVDEICRFGEGADGRFVIVRRYPLGR